MTCKSSQSAAQQVRRSVSSISHHEWLDPPCIFPLWAYTWAVVESSGWVEFRFGNSKLPEFRHKVGFIYWECEVTELCPIYAVLFQIHAIWNFLSFRLPYFPDFMQHFRSSLVLRAPVGTLEAYSSNHWLWSIFFSYLFFSAFFATMFFSVIFTQNFFL